jgi:hypothetical protein
MKIITLLLIGSTLLSVTACANDDPFMHEITAATKVKNTQHGKSLDHIVIKYIPPGTSVIEAVRFLEQREFKVKEIVPERDRLKVPSGQVWYSARHRQSPYLIVEMTTYIQLHTDGNEVIDAKGKYWLTGF